MRRSVKDMIDRSGFSLLIDHLRSPGEDHVLPQYPMLRHIVSHCVDGSHLDFCCDRAQLFLFGFTLVDILIFNYFQKVRYCHLS